MDFFSKNDAGSVPKKISFLKIMILYSWKNTGFFFQKWRWLSSQNSIFWIFVGFFFPKMTLAQFPIFGFFFQDSQIGVNSLFCWSMENNETYRITSCAFIAKLSLNKLLVTHELGFNLRLALSQIKNVPGASSVLTNMRTFKNVSQNMFGS